MSTQSIVRGSLIALSVLLTSACTGAGTRPETGAPAASAATTKINYLTSFNVFGRDSYAYVALEKGYFKDAGFDVAIKPGSGTADSLKLIASGQADFGITDLTGSIVTLAGQKMPVTGVAAIHQRSLTAVIALDGAGISAPKDLEGKKVADPPGSAVKLVFPAYAKAAGIDPAKVTFVPAPPPSLPQLLASGEVDAIGQFVVGRPTIEQAAQGRKAVVLPYSDHIKEMYGNILTTTVKMATEQPDLVKRFRDALLKGLEYAVDHPDETGEILKKYQPTQNPVTAAAELREMAAFVRSSEAGVPVGALDESRVAAVIAILEDAKVVPPGFKPSDIVTFGLTPGS
ncbi:ABC transporter substrate-binding protein [Streptosporangium amethystogenes]|uniref:ABC transporter substrate-binding protein n=1 Tax=Streptosporangium amethystogenes TaxID=2002 RepID=UPI0007C811B4|nr:ABC transporter substrate-binding protein [Streptosporangium amethystogenes]